MIESLLQAERLLLHGLVDQAEALYRRTLEADPRNAIALVGLARVAIERGDDKQAYREAVLALEVDQRNPAALRLEARLSEVLAARGEAVERPAWLSGGAASVPESAAAVPESAAAAPDSPPPERDAERAVLARNPSMADHERMRAQRSQPSPSAASPEPTARRRGLLRRLLGR